jgi:phage-related protein
MNSEDKSLVWLHGEVKTPPFSKEARLEAGLLLRRLQSGEKLSLPHSRPMPNIGSRVHELRIVDRNATWRIVYRIDADAVIIGEVFSKKSRETPKGTIRTCKDRFKSFDLLVGEQRNEEE